MRLNAKLPKILHCDLDEMIEDFTIRLSTTEHLDIIEEEFIPILAVYAMEYMVTRQSSIFKAIVSYCRPHLGVQRELVDIFRTVVDNHPYLVTAFHQYFDIHRHYVYLHHSQATLKIVIRDDPDESHIPVLYPGDDEDEELY